MDLTSLAICSVKDVRQLEKAAIDSGSDRELLLLKAGYQVAFKISQLYPKKHVVVLSGPGLNGKDGLYAGFFLQEMGWKVSVLTFYWPNTLTSHDFLAKKLGLRIAKFKIENIHAYMQDTQNILFIDAIFGAGLNKSISQDLQQFVQAVNDAKVDLVAVDIPSGINADTGIIMGKTFQATYTITFTTSKIAHFLMPAKKFIGSLIVVDIGLGNYFQQNQQQIYKNHPLLWRDKLPREQPEYHKYNRGVVSILSGQMTGSVRLAAQAARMSGIGLVKIICHDNDKLIYSLDSPENVVIHTHELLDYLKIYTNQKKYNHAFLIGSGFDASIHNQKLVLELLSKGVPTVIDGGAISCFEDNINLIFDNIHEEVILTPHEGEFIRIFPQISGNKIQKAIAAASLSKATIVLKGPDTVVASSKGQVIIETPPSNLSVAGTGDVLAGIIVSLIGQGLKAFDAACVAVWTHAESARRVSHGLTATTLTQQISFILESLRNKL